MTTSLHSASVLPGLQGCRVGANPIIWTNDDFPELGDDTSLEACLTQMREAGFSGTELGRKFPREREALRAVLRRYDLDLVSGWHSTHLAERDYAEEARRFATHLELLRALAANVVIVAECTRCVHGSRLTPLGFSEADRPRLQEHEWWRLTDGLARLCAEAALSGLTTVYHHHMGTVIQSEAELDRLLGAVPSLHLLLDPGHLAFAGIDALSVTRRYRERVAHVHLKSVRGEVVARARSERWSFCQAVRAGVFTIPGDGAVDFPALFRELAEARYSGWLVVEAEEDPTLAPPLTKATRARAYVRAQTGL